MTEQAEPTQPDIELDEDLDPDGPSDETQEGNPPPEERIAK